MGNLKKMGNFDFDVIRAETLGDRVVSRDKRKKESDKQMGVERSQERNVIRIRWLLCECNYDGAL